MHFHIPVFILDKFIILPSLETKLDISNEISKKVIEASSKNDINKVLVICPTNSKEVSPSIEDLPKVGVICDVKSKIELSNGLLRTTLVGIKRVRIDKYYKSEKSKILKCGFTEIELPKFNKTKETTLIRKLKSLLEEYIDVKEDVSNSILKGIKDNNDLNSLTDMITSFVTFDFPKKLMFMEEINPIKRAEKLIEELYEEISVANLDKELSEKMASSLEDEQRKYLLKEKLKEINSELGNTKDEEIASLLEKLASLNISQTSKNKIQNEINKYNAASEFSPEASVIKNYLDVLLNLPWDKESKLNLDLNSVKKIMDENHYGLDEVKNRIYEYVKLKKHCQDIKSPIICLVGMPGTGKTSIAMAIAKALNLEFYKMSVGGLNDSTELIGSRRTYLGALPGKIMQGIIKSNVNNPLILIDEVDKMVKDYKGDPASTLLEILDETQNKYFTDNYIEEPFNLSKVFFILTANNIENIPPILLDRLEVINVSEYSIFEKVNIGKKYLLNKINNEYHTKYNLTDNTIKYIINNYTNEAGVRDLKRKLEQIIRKAFFEDNKNTISISDIDNYLKYKNIKMIPNISDIGISNVLAYTTLGGQVSHVEVSKIKGDNLIITGNVKEILCESIKVVISYLENNYNLPKNTNYHVHFISASTPKDGPSAGISIALAILSLVKNIKLSDEVAYTGELTLKGDILPIGGIKEKLLAAKAHKIKKVFIPLANKNDVDCLDKQILENIEIKYVSDFKEIYNATFK